MRRFGVDVSRFQDPAAPAGVPWQKIGERSTFAIARLSYGAWPDPRAEQHLANARTEALQVGGYHFLVTDQDIRKQLDTFLAQAVKCRIGPGDIVPALDIEEDGPRKITRLIEPLVRLACDILIDEFGGVMPYIRQDDWVRLGSPEWMLELPLWVANYTNAPKPTTPGGVAPAIWQNRVGPYAPGAPFVTKEAFLPNAIDQNVADAPLPFLTRTPHPPGQLPPVGPEPPHQSAVWQRRLDAFVASEYDRINTGLSGDDADDDPTRSDHKV